MSSETGGLTVPAHEAKRPLPPEVKFNATTATFSGKAEPTKTVRLTDSSDQRMRTATADADGAWKIVLGQAPRLYTTYEIWVCDGQDGESSDKVKFTLGGNNPKLHDVYASQTVVFGRATPGSKVVVFGPEGQVLGRSLALDRYGVWAVRFGEAIATGDKVCVLAEAFNGSTSMPHFIKAETFSVNDRNVGHIAGAGAEPGDQIQLYDTETYQSIASTIASEAGTFEFSFCDPLKAGLRLSVQRSHSNGTTSSGPVFTTQLNDCEPPVITIFSGSKIAGRAVPGLQVTYSQVRDKKTVHSDTVTTPKNGQWSSDDAAMPHAFDFQSGDILTATAKSADGTQESLISSNVTFNGVRPGVPVLTEIDSKGASGRAEASMFIVASTQADGVIALAQASEFGGWKMDWTDTVGALPSTTIVVFEACKSVLQNETAPNSITTACYADSLLSKPDAPVIVKYMTTDIAGTQNVPVGEKMAVVVYDKTKGEDVGDSGGVDVVNGLWENKPDPADKTTPDNKDEVIATGWILDSHGAFLLDSPPSSPQIASSFVPPRPDVQVKYPDDIEGVEFILVTADQAITSVNIAPELDISRTPVGNSRLSGTSWSINPVTPSRTPGEKMVAWAVTDAGAKSGETPFTIEAAEKPLPPIIGSWESDKIIGSGVPKYTVMLEVNDSFVGSAVVDDERNWVIDIGAKPPTNTKLKATTKETPTATAVSDPFYITVGQTRAVLKIDSSSVTTSGLQGTTTNLPQIIVAWRTSDGLMVVNQKVNSSPFSCTYLANSNIKSGDVIRLVSQNDTGDPEASYSTITAGLVN